MPKIPQQQKTKNKLYIACVQDSDGRIIKILIDENYEHAWLKVSSESKSSRGYWVIFDNFGRQIDGNFRPVHIV